MSHFKLLITATIRRRSRYLFISLLWSQWVDLPFWFTVCFRIRLYLPYHIYQHWGCEYPLQYSPEWSVTSLQQRHQRRFNSDSVCVFSFSHVLSLMQKCQSGGFTLFTAWQMIRAEMSTSCSNIPQLSAIFHFCVSVLEAYAAHPGGQISNSEGCVCVKATSPSLVEGG